ncbi:MAG: LacI family DNA-binding transcriptional regulator [Rhizobiales bacterium]|nr:LacI family DNA-binding transcriptional regulator [Hyphomicrobiales bacterium]
MKPSANRPTIINIADLAGVSKSTVARVLSDDENVKKSTREKVLNVAKSIGYERNHLAKSLRSGRTGMLGLLIPDIANPFWAEVAAGAQDRASDANASLLVFSSNWDPKREKDHLKSLRQARVDGAIVNPVEDSIDGLDRFGMPVVLIGSSAELFPQLSSVGSDIKQGVHIGLDLLTSLGHTQPAFIVGPSGKLARARFLAAVNEYYSIQNIDQGELLVEEAEYTIDSGREAALKLLSRAGSKPLCIFTTNDLMAFGALLAVRESGLNCPDDVSILGFDGIFSGEISYPGLSTVVKPARKIGRRAVDLLLGNINGNEGNERIVLPCELKIRGSLADVSSARYQAI